jgi:myo-inositol-hexaphosphate 3-phosphohydrolase
MVDERDGIMLDRYVYGNSLHGAFTVQGNIIVDNYRVEGNKMFVGFFSIKLNDKKTSGKGTEETPFVDSYKVSNYQMGVLVKQ